MEAPCCENCEYYGEGYCPKLDKDMDADALCTKWERKEEDDGD